MGRQPLRSIQISGGSRPRHSAIALSEYRLDLSRAPARMSQRGTPNRHTMPSSRPQCAARPSGWPRTSRPTTVRDPRPQQCPCERASPRDRSGSDLTVPCCVWARGPRQTGATRIMPGSHLRGRHPLAEEGVNSGQHLGSIPICGPAGSCALYGECDARCPACRYLSLLLSVAGQMGG